MGILVDFITGGLLKIIWFAIYATTYLALGMTLGTYLARFSQSYRQQVIFFLAGTLFGHLMFAGDHHRPNFQMNFESYSPIVLTSPQFSESLFLTSDDFTSKLGRNVKKVDVLFESLSDYACVKSFEILSVDGIDVRNTSWTWRALALEIRTNFDSPTTDRSPWPWCWYQFYRS